MKSAIKIIKEVVNQMDNPPRFIAEGWDESSSLLSYLEFDHENDGKKYPLLILDPYFEEECGIESASESSFNAIFYFITETQSEYTTEQRIDNVYTPILYPLLVDFIYTAFRSGKFVFDKNPVMSNEIRLEHKKEHLWYAPNRLNDIVDALKINLTLKIRK
jgi:hypothetical protein